MYHLPLRASAAIASGLALVSLFGAASPALAKGGHHSSETPAAAAPAATAVDTPGVDTPAPAAPAEDTPRVDTPAVDTPASSAPAEDTPRVDTPAPDASAPATPAADAPATPAAGVPAPQAPAPAPVDCLADPTVVAMTTPDLAVNYAGDAGCVAVLVTPGTNRLAWVVPAAGWSYEVERNGGSTNDRVELRFTKADTGDRIDFRYELGKTSIG